MESKIPELDTPKTWPEWLKEKIAPEWAMIRLGHEAMMLDKIQKQNKIVLDNVRSLNSSGGMGGGAGEEGEDDMGVNVGNTTHNHYSTETVQTSQGSTLGKLATAAALLTAGGAGALGLASYLKPDYHVAPPAMVDTDSDTTVEGGFLHKGQ